MNRQILDYDSMDPMNYKNWGVIGDDVQVA